jgi:hypothetical protein
VLTGIWKNTRLRRLKANSPFFELSRLFVRFDHIASIVVNASVALSITPSSSRVECVDYNPTASLYLCYDYQIYCPHFCNRTCHHLRCASSITRGERIARRITLTGGESCIALTGQVANGFAQSKTHSQESES